MHNDTSQAPDPRRHAYRPDLADRALRDRVTADRFVDPVPCIALAPVTAVRTRPDHQAPRDTEVLFGEQLGVLEIKDDWAWVQLATDGYVGYVPADRLGDAADPPTHRVRSRTAIAYSVASALSEPLLQLPLNACVRVVSEADGFSAIAGGGFVGSRHLAGWKRDFAADFVAVAEGFVGVPYLYGGRSAIGGIDCSGLVQMALAAAGIAAPRDSDMQAGEVGRVVAGSDTGFEGFQRGDLVFWPGHVAIIRSADTVVHASATNMCVAFEPLDAVIARSQQDDGSRFTCVRRL